MEQRHGVEQVITQRGRSLENAFFAEQDEILIARLREAERARSRREALAAASGITDPAVLAALEARNLDARTVAALALAPLVLVAWADGALDPREKAAVQSAAQQVPLGPEARALLDGWLSAPPDPRLAEAWQSYAHALAAGLAAPARAALRAETLGRARRVAEAAGGFLGLGRRVSAAEERVLAELERAFAA